jgi:hypothetical protein
MAAVLGVPIPVDSSVALLWVLGSAQTVHPADPERHFGQRGRPESTIDALRGYAEASR